MKDDEKTKEELIDELAEMRLRIAELENTQTRIQQMGVVFNSVADAICVLDMEDRFLDCNTAMLNFLGKPIGEVIGNTCWKLVHGTSEPIENCPVVRTRKSRTRETMEMPVGEQWFDVSADPIVDEAGDLVGAVHILSDITERKRAEEKLQDSEQQLQSIIQGYPIPAFMIGKDHRVIHWNRALEEVSGIGASAVIGTSQHWRAFYREERPCMADLLVDEDQEALEHWYAERVSKSGILEEAYEATQFFPDLSQAGKWLRFTAAAIRNSRGMIVGAIETLEDVSDRKEAEEVLRESENRYRAIFENTGTATVILEEDTTISIANAEFEKLTGYTREEIENKKSWTEFVAQEDMEGMLGRHRQRRVDADATRKQYEFSLADRHGQTKNIFLTVDMIPGTKRSVASLLDITERKRAEEALREKTEELDRFFTLSVELLCIADLDGHFRRLNRAWEVLLGYELKELTGTKFLDLIHPDDIESTMAAMSELTSGERVIDFVNRYRHKDGTYRWINWRSVPVQDRWIYAVASDITERKKDADALRESQQRLQDIINFLPDATFVIDKEGKVIAWNRAIEEMTEIKAQDMLGKGNYEYALPFYGERRPILIDLVLDPREEFNAHYVDVERKEALLAGEAYMPALRGGGVYLFGTASVLHDSKGDVAGAIESIRDITERRRVEEALASAERKYRGIFENAVMGITQTTPEGRILSINAAFAQMLGYDTPEEAMNTVTDITRQVYVNPEQRSELLRLVEAQGAIKEFELQFFRKDRSTAWFSLNMRAVRDDSGKLLYLEGFTQDITARKALESRLIQAQKMEAMGTLSGGIAHDFNNILSAILGYTEIIRSKIEQPALRRHLQQILTACDRAKNLIGQILTFSRTVEQKKSPIDMASITKEALELLRASIPSTIKILSEIDPGAHTVFADPTQIHQVLINLCTNASQAMRERGGLLEVNLGNFEITPQNSLPDPNLGPGPYVKLTVSDTGTGIAPEIVHRIFDPFFTTKKIGEGTGLGLSVVYGIVRGCRGAVAVQSKPGVGSVFSVYLPATANLAEVTADDTRPDPGGEARILLVDDEEILVEMWREMLGDLGYQTTGLTDSTKALELFRNQPDQFDLVITDMTMPNMTGIDLSKEILRLRPGIPIILCTGFNELISEEKAGELGIQGFAMKPLSLRNVADLISKALDRK
jgi:PAS domain S-box-containing protein